MVPIKYAMHQLVSMNLYVLQKNIQSDTYEWTSDKLYVEADETFWELCAVGRCARVVTSAHAD